MHPVHAFSPHSNEIHFNIILPTTLHLRFSGKKCMHLVFPNACYMACPFHPPRFDRPIKYIVKCRSYEALHYAVFYSLLELPFRSKYSPQHPVLKHLHSVFFPLCERLSFKFIVVYILIYQLSKRRRQDRRF